jgi:hypothetical protein
VHNYEYSTLTNTPHPMGYAVSPCGSIVRGRTKRLTRRHCLSALTLVRSIRLMSISSVLSNEVHSCCSSDFHCTCSLLDSVGINIPLDCGVPTRTVGSHADVLHCSAQSSHVIWEVSSPCPVRQRSSRHSHCPYFIACMRRIHSKFNHFVIVC